MNASKEFRELAQQKMSGRSHAPIRDVSPLTFASTKQPPCVRTDRLLQGARLYLTQKRQVTFEIDLLF